MRAPTFEPAFHAHWQRASLAELLVALVVIASPLAVGGVHLAVKIAVAGTLLVGFVMAAQRLHRDQRRVRVGLIGWAFAIALLVTFLQWLPLPSGLVAMLNPASFEARAIVARTLGESVPDWMPLTLDQGRTAAAFIGLLGVNLAYLAGTSLRTDSAATNRLTIVVEVAALLVMAVGVVQSIFGIDRIFGLYEASVDTSGVPFLATFVNPNHAAALMLLGALVAFGASLSSERNQRWHLPVGVALAIGVVLTMSRANALLLIAGLLALTIPPLLQRRHRDIRPRLWRLLVGTLACLFVAVVLIGPERWLAELGRLGQTELADQGLVRECWRVGLDVGAMAPGVGVGNGAFVVAAAQHTIDWNVGLITYAHQGVLQIIAELGWPVGVAVLSLTAVGFVLAAVRGRKSLPMWGTIVGLGAVALQNGVDFSLWTHGVGIPAAVMLGVAVQVTWPDAARQESSWLFPAWRWPLVASAVFLGALVVALPVAWRERPEAWQDDARVALRDQNPTAIDRGEILRAHPHDYLAFDLAAALADQNGRRDEARAWSGRALALAPTEPTTLAGAVRLRLVADEIASASALVERLDAQGPLGRERALTIVLEAGALPGAKALMDAYFGKLPERVVAADQRLFDQGNAEAARRLLAWALTRFPDTPAIYEAFGQRMQDDLERLGRLATECLAKAGLAKDPATRAAWERLGYAFQGRIAMSRARFQEAWVLFNTAADLGVDPSGRDRVSALILAGKAAARLENVGWLDEALAHLGKLELRGPWENGEFHFLKSRRHEISGDLPRAIREMHEVVRYLGHVAGFHDRLADLFYRSDDQEAGDRARARARALELSP